MKRFLSILIMHFALSIVNCPAATLKTCMKSPANNASFCKLAALSFLAAPASGTYGHTRGAGDYSGARTWQWRPSAAAPSNAEGVYDDSAHRVEGTHVCATNGGTPAQAGTPSGTGGHNCWCKVIKLNGVPCAGAWVFQYGGEDALYCSLYCAVNCVDDVQYIAGFRAAVLAMP